MWTPLRVLLFALWCVGGCIYRLVTAPLPRVGSLLCCGCGDDTAATSASSPTSSSSSSSSKSSAASAPTASAALTLVDYFNLAQQLERRLGEIAQVRVRALGGCLSAMRDESRS
jgi:hypothetical protein